MRYNPSEPNAAQTQANWERFLRLHPRHRPGTSYPRRQACRMPCLVQQVALESTAWCRRRNCPGHGSWNEALRQLSDHAENWHYDDGEGDRQIVLVSHRTWRRRQPSTSSTRSLTGYREQSPNESALTYASPRRTRLLEQGPSYS